MVSLVIVSHSARLAEGVAELARGVGGGGVALATAGGLDLPGQPLGTDPMLVLRAIDEVYSREGVLVLMDLGSALLSAEMALEMLSPEQREHVVLCEAPLVEGAVAAAVQASLGSSLVEVLASARGALGAKAAQLGGDPSGAAARTPGDPAASADHERRVRVADPTGLHARPAAEFVQLAGKFTGTEIAVRNLTAGRGPANARSILQVLTLGVSQGDEILLSASGPDAGIALDALVALVSVPQSARPA
jgi:multiphosphoryl transfer protein